MIPQGVMGSHGDAILAQQAKWGAMTKQMMLAIGLALSAGTIGVCAGTAAFGQSADDQQACMNDAFQFCGDAIPDRSKVFYCLVNNRSQISPGCRVAMAPYLPAEPVVAMRKSPASHDKTAKSKGPLSLTPH
jgi:hypothetical protein